MKIARTSLTLGIVQSRSRSRHELESFLHLPQYKAKKKGLCFRLPDRLQKNPASSNFLL